MVGESYYRLSDKGIPTASDTAKRFDPSDDWKFVDSSKEFHAAIGKILEMGYSDLDYIHHNPAFAGSVNIARFLSIYEIYKDVVTLSGDIAEVGVFKGSTFLYFAKLLEIFEPHSYTRVHGFDWFEGMDPASDETGLKPGAYKADYERFLKLVEVQGLDHVAKVHKPDVTKDLDSFFAERQGMIFKLVFLDVGTYDVVRAALPYFWPKSQKAANRMLNLVPRRLSCSAACASTAARSATGFVAASISFCSRLHQPDDIGNRRKQAVLVELFVVVPFLFGHAIEMDNAAIALPHQRAEANEKDPPFRVRHQGN